MRTFLLLVLAAVVTLTMQRYVGGETIYAAQNVAQRDSAHQLLLTNRLPPGQTWRSIGLAGARARAATVFLAEEIHRASGLTLRQTYLIIDTLALFASLLVLYGFLTLVAPPALALYGWLYFCLTLPLTYALFVFHPWDRLSVLFWLAALYCLRAERLLAFAGMLVAGMLVKYDMVLLPGLYFLASVRRDNVRRVTLITAALSLLALGTYVFLSLQFGDGIGPRDQVWRQVSRNLAYFASEVFVYPPLLAFAVPLGLAALGWSTADRFARAAVAFAGVQAVLLFLITNFQEVRAEVPVLILLLPAALAGLRTLLPAVAPAPRPGAP